ncbi:hypothetical protein [Hoeflea sp.]|uniref:hypothetical protein n=1 Tax=Hoeflea sp. TaxID=1940281 RepID=UPI00199F9FDB|nr:hypothetical protein [Hoeflea sp.]MBC7282586.1 hypothetical protein [Hoeflea sp.]
MSLYEKIEQVGASVFGAFILSVGGGIMWVIRRILTNQKQIELLQSEIKHRDALRKEDREAVREVRDEVKALRTEIRDVFRRLE